MWAAVVTSLVLSAAPEMTARTLDGREVSGTLEELSGARVVLRSGDKTTTIEPDQLLSLTPRSAPRPGGSPLPMRIELVDGSRLVASDYEVTGGQVTLVGREMVLTGPSKAVSIAHLKPTTDAAKPVWAKLRADHKAKIFKGDVLVVTRGETVDTLEGVLHDTEVKEGRKIIKFAREDEMPLEVAFERVDGLIYLNAAAAETADPLCAISDADGSQLRLKAVALKDGRIEFETVGGLKGSRPLEQLTALDFSAGKVAYLGGDHELASDELGPLRKPVFQPSIAGQQPLPTEREMFKPRSKNRFLPDDELGLGGKKYKRGLMIKADWSIEYALRGQYRRLQAIVGVDDNRKFGAELVIEGDGKPLVKEVIRKEQQAKTLDLDISGVRILKIRVNSVQGVSGFANGVLDLCEAKVTK